MSDGPAPTRQVVRVLVANRGEIARRVIRTCRSLGIETVAVFSDADAGSPFVREADVAVRLPGVAAADTYLRTDLVLGAARTAGADAVHPGYGFLSEDAGFARAVVGADLTWIGPDPDTIEQMGSKVRAKQIMADAGVPVLGVVSHSSTSPQVSASELCHSADKFPVLVKASAGGGGRGMRVVRRPEDLDAEVAAAQAEALSAFGDGTVFVEPYRPTARHVEVQVLADRYGTCWVLGERDCSVQRRHQKVVEETPAPCLDDAVRTRLHEAARRAVDAVGYVGAGTVEFLVDTGDEHGRSLVDSGDGSGAEVYFLEMNTRLQVEHPVTECVTGTDLVALQIAVAEGHPLRGEAPVPWGHAVEVRVYAEDPADGWAPQTGVLRAFDVPGAESTFRVPGGYGLRVDSAVEPGTEVGVHYDAMLAKLVAWAPDRPAAIRMLRGAVRRARVHGVRTNLDLLSAVLADEEFVAGRVHTTLLDERLERWTAPRLSEDVVRRYAVAAALSDAAAAQSSRTVQRRIPPAFRNVSSAPRTRSYRLAGRETEVAYRDVRGRLAVEGGAVADGTVTVLEATPQRVRLECRGVVEAYAVSRTGPYADVDGPSGAATLEAVPRFVDPAAQVAHGSLLAPMPAAVVAVAVERGQRVARGQPVVVLEAMKMQHTISAPADGTVAELSVGAGDQVSSGAVLAVIEGDPDE